MYLLMHLYTRHLELHGERTLMKYCERLSFHCGVKPSIVDYLFRPERQDRSEKFEIIFGLHHVPGGKCIELIVAIFDCACICVKCANRVRSFDTCYLVSVFFRREKLSFCC